MFHSKFALVTKTCFLAYKNLNNFHFGGIFVFSSNFGRNLQNHKTGFQWIWLATVPSRGGCSAAGAEPPRPTPPRAWPCSCLATRARRDVDEPPACSSTPLLIPLRGRLAYPFLARRRRPGSLPQIRLPRSLSHSFEQSTTFATSLRTQSTPSSLPNPPNRRHSFFSPNSG